MARIFLSQRRTRSGEEKCYRLASALEQLDSTVHQQTSTPADQAMAAARHMPWMAGASVLALTSIGLAWWSPWDTPASRPIAPVDKQQAVSPAPASASERDTGAASTLILRRQALDRSPTQRKLALRGASSPDARH